MTHSDKDCICDGEDIEYRKSDIPDLEWLLIQAEKAAKQCDKDNDHKLQYSNRHKREAQRIRKLIELIQLCGVVEDYDYGLALVNRKFIVSLGDNKWRILGKNKWYRHKNDLKHFVDNYVYKEWNNETNS